MRARVLWLIKGLGLGGAERLVATMAPRLDRDRYDLEVAYLLADSADLAPELERHGVCTHCLDAGRTAETGWPRRLRRLLRTGAYDLVHTHSPLPATVARLTAPRAARLVHTEHNLWSSYRRPTYVANALTYPRNAAVLAVSDAVAASIRPRWWARPGSAPPVDTLRHGVARRDRGATPAARATARRDLGLAEHASVVGSIGSLTHQKDPVGLVAAFAPVATRLDDAVLVVVGSGPLEPDVRAEVARRHLDGRVRLVGPRVDAESVLPALDVFVLASRYEGLPIALLEAMGAGLACVAARVGGVPEALGDGVEGLLVDPGEPDALAAAVTSLLEDPARREAMGAAAAARVAREFDIDRAVATIERCYDGVLS